MVRFYGCGTNMTKSGHEKKEAAPSYRRTTSDLNQNRLRLTVGGVPGVQVTFQEAQALCTSALRAKKWL